jgi:hypothetical protein
MKHLLFMLIAVVFAGNLAAQNLLTDPGFENMDPTDWNTTYAGVEMPLKLDVEGWYHRKVANTLIVSDIATDEFHSGSKSAELRINDGAGNFQWYRNIIAQKVSIQLQRYCGRKMPTDSGNIRQGGYPLIWGVMMNGNSIQLLLTYLSMQPLI